MTMKISRPAAAAEPAGMLSYDQFQTAYVTNDLDRALLVFRDHHNVQNWTVFEPGGGMRIALAWVNGQQLELIDTGASEQPLYDDWIKDKGEEFVIRFHHFGYFIYNDEEWAAMRRQIDADNRVPEMDGETEMLKVIYIKVAELGHYLEYIYPNEQGRAFFESVASN